MSRVDERWSGWGGGNRRDQVGEDGARILGRHKWNGGHLWDELEIYCNRNF